MSARAQFIEQEAGTYSVTELCEAMQISRASYYRCLRQSKTPQKQADASRVARVFWRHSRRYGSRRIHAELKAEGECLGRHRIRRLMREQGLRAIQPRSFIPRTTQSAHTFGYSPNLLLDMQLPPEKPSAVLVGDITYLPLQSGSFAYLATWTDLFSRRIVGWAVAEHMRDELVINALKMALRKRKLAAEVIVHTDRGGQYASREFRALLKRQGCRQSMSRADEAYDNAYAESLFSRYKAELLEGGKFTDVEEARIETFNYIEGYYNRVRRHSSLGYVSPEEYERKFYERDGQSGKVKGKKKGKGGKSKAHSCLTF